MTLPPRPSGAASVTGELALSVTFRVKGKLPAVVKMPEAAMPGPAEIKPARTIPGDTAPEFTVQLYGPTPPETVQVTV